MERLARVLAVCGISGALGIILLGTYFAAYNAKWMSENRIWVIPVLFVFLALAFIGCAVPPHRKEPEVKKRKDRMYQGELGLLVVLAAVVFAGCASYDPRPRVIYAPPKTQAQPAVAQAPSPPAQVGGVPEEIAKEIRGRKVYVGNLPQELSIVVRDYVRASGGYVVGYDQDLEFRYNSWTENLSYAGAFGRITFSNRSRFVFQLALIDRRQSDLLLFVGEGSSVLYGWSDSSAVRRAGIAAFINLH